MLTEKTFIFIDTRTLALILGIGALCLACFQGLIAWQFEPHAFRAVVYAWSFAPPALGSILVLASDTPFNFFESSLPHLLIVLSVFSVICYWRAVTALNRERLPGEFCFLLLLANGFVFNGFWPIQSELSARLTGLSLSLGAVTMPLCIILLVTEKMPLRGAARTGGIALSVMLLLMLDRTIHLFHHYSVYQSFAYGMQLPALSLEASQFAMLLAGGAFIAMAGKETTAAWSLLAMQDSLIQILNRLLILTGDAFSRRCRNHDKLLPLIPPWRSYCLTGMTSNPSMKNMVMPWATRS